VGLYLVEDLLVDADLFRRLRARGLARGPEGIADLETALQLVTGRPFDQLRPAGWTWLIDGDRVDHHLICAVTDVAHILVTGHLHTGDLDAAKHAATIALTADPDSETARLDLAGIMIHDGHTASARQIVADALGDDADLDRTARANDILDQKRWLETG
jgi:thioredoxin-like negative regulator of GroEL